MTATPAPEIIALTVDLMDRSKITGALPTATVVRSLAALGEVAHPDAVILVDLGRIDDPAVLAEVQGRVIAFGSHVAEAVLAAAADAGVEALPRSVFFRRLGDGSLI